MKKILSILVLLLMVISVVPLAFAQEDAVTTTEGDVETVEDVAVETTDDAAADTDVPEETSETDEGVITDEPLDETSDEPTEETPSEDTETSEEETEETVEEDETVEETGSEETPADEDPGITPDSPLWGIERAIERISLALTFNKAAKAKKGLAHARERLLEVQAMIQAKRMAAAEEAQEAYGETMSDVQEEIADLGNGDAEQTLEEELGIEEVVAANNMLVQKIAGNMLKTKGLDQKQVQAAEQIMASLGNSTSGVKAQIQVKKDKTKIKIKAQKGMSQEEIVQLEEQIKAGVTDGNVKIVGPSKGGKKQAAVEEEEEASEEDEGTASEDGAVEESEEDSETTESVAAKEKSLKAKEKPVKSGSSKSGKSK